MNKLWAGFTSGDTDKLADEFNSSIAVDQRMYAQDIKGSMAHAVMLESCGIISEGEKDAIVTGLMGILDDIDSGKLAIDLSCEDIHMFVEQVLTERIGDAGKKLHTARSRNDQVALDLRLYLRDEISALKELTKDLAEALTDAAEKYSDCIMPGYTHLQRAQPVLFSHQILAYAMMLLRDLGRLDDCGKRMNVSPIGSCALAGTTYKTDRRAEAQMLGFSDICLNSIDGVSDRDFCLELMSAASIEMTHLSRLAEELVLWSSWEFRFVRIGDAYTTGSSIMPQKKNPDMAELVRGKTGRVFGDMMTLFTVLKGLPLAYNKDMQEDKEAVFDSVDTLKKCLAITASMIRSMEVFPQNMRKAAAEGFINATDMADYLVRKGEPFRSAYKISGEIVARCMEKGFTLETLPLVDYKCFSPLFGEDIYDSVDLENCVERRCSEGGTGPDSVKAQIVFLRKELEK